MAQRKKQRNCCFKAFFLDLTPFKKCEKDAIVIFPKKCQKIVFLEKKFMRIEIKLFDQFDNKKSLKLKF